MFNSILSSTTSLTPVELLSCMGISLVLGIVIALIHSFKNPSSRSMLLALVVLPVIIQTVIMLVNGSVGTGIAVMGAFSLIRFRSQPGDAREITSIFLATAAGLAMALGYVGIAVVVVVIVGIVTIILALSGLASEKQGASKLKVTIPENLDYNGLFDDLFETFTTSWVLDKVKTANMGSLYELSYTVVFKRDINQKEFLDAVRCRNGNLNIVCGRAQYGAKDEL